MLNQCRRKKKGKWRLFLKTQGSAILKKVRIGPDVCPVLHSELERCWPRIEAEVNGGCNYDDPKVAKFLAA